MHGRPLASINAKPAMHMVPGLWHPRKPAGSRPTAGQACQHLLLISRLRSVGTHSKRSLLCTGVMFCIVGPQDLGTLPC